LVFAVPDALSDAQAASLPSAYLTAWLALHERGRLQPGETMVVAAAAGGVGSAAVQLGLAAGARVIAVTRGPKVAVAERLGAHVVIDAEAPGSLAERVREETGGRGVDLVFDPVGGDTYHALARALAFGGRILVVGFAGGEIQTAELNRPLLRNTSIVGVNCGLYVRHRLDLVRPALAELAALAAAGRIDPLVDSESPLAQTGRRLQDLGDGTTVGRAVIVL
jgi:NADPH2:quinone reductase